LRADGRHLSGELVSQNQGFPRYELTDPVVEVIVNVRAADSGSPDID
jgi:hypothetical protein